MRPGDEGLLVAASHLFDEPVQQGWAARFLAEPSHHLCLAMVGDEPAGFVSGVAMTHPDKGTEMFLYELGVDDAHRGAGIGAALTSALAARAADLGCSGMWVLTDEDNAAALATYRSAGAGEPAHHVLLEWRFT